MARSLNPYIAGNPVGNSNAFTGRADIVREVLHIFARPEENALVLYGQRRIGKTSVLQFLKKTLAQETATGHYFPVYFDLQDKATFALGDVLKDLASTIANELGFPAPQLGDNPEHVFQYEWLPQQLEKLEKGAALVLLFDEFDVLAAESAKGAGADFFPYLRKLIASDRQRLNFVFVIGRNVNDLNTIALSLFKGITARRVSLLGKEDTFALIRLAEKTSPLRWSGEALERIWQLTNGHAFFTQQLCSFAWEEVYNDGDFETEEISASVVERVVDDALGAARNAFEWLWDGLPPAERVVSAALAQAGGKAVTETELEKLLHESGVRIVIRELQDAPKLLQEWDLLEPVDGGFRFRVELLRRWVEENKPLRRVQDELDRIEPVAESLFQAAQGLYRNSQLDAAEDLLRKAVGINPNHVKANKLLADILLANQKYEEAKNLLVNLYEYQPIEIRSRLIQAWMGLASLTNNTNEKLSCYDTILKIDANQSEAKEAAHSIRKKERELYLTRIFKELDYLKTHKKYNESLKLITYLEENFPDISSISTIDFISEKNKLKQLITITIYYEQALDAIKLGKNKHAQELLVKVICFDPEFEEAARYLCLAVTGNDYKLLEESLHEEKTKNGHLILKLKELRYSEVHTREIPLLESFFETLVLPSIKWLFLLVFFSITIYLFNYKFDMVGIFLGAGLGGLVINIITDSYNSNIESIKKITVFNVWLSITISPFIAIYQYVNIVAANGQFGDSIALIAISEALVIIYTYILYKSNIKPIIFRLSFFAILLIVNIAIYALLKLAWITLVWLIFLLWLLLVFVITLSVDSDRFSLSVLHLGFLGILLISLTNIYLCHNLIGKESSSVAGVLGVVVLITLITQLKEKFSYTECEEFFKPHPVVMLLVILLAVFVCFDTFSQLIATT